MKEIKQIRRSGASPSLTSGIGARINKVAEMVGSKRALAQSIGLSESQLYRLITGDSQAKIETITAVARAGDISMEWLSTGCGSPDIGVSEPPGGYKIGCVGRVGEYALIPLYSTSIYADGKIATTRRQVIDHLAFKRSWIENDLHANPLDLYLIPVQTNAMAPTINAGDVIMIDSLDRAIHNNGIYALVTDGVLQIARLQNIPGDTVRVISDNPVYPPYEIKKEWFQSTQDERSGVVGRVVWSAHQHR